MGTCTSCRIGTSTSADIDQHADRDIAQEEGGHAVDEEGDLVGDQAGVEDQETHIQDLITNPCSFSSSLSSRGRPFRLFLNFRPHMAREESLMRMYERSSYWVYATFNRDERVRQSFYAFDLHNHDCVFLPDHHLVNSLFGSTTAVLNKRLYVIGGESAGFISKDVHMFDPISYKWFLATPTSVRRQGALATTVSGKIYVFGGCVFETGTDAWAEVYEPSTGLWTPIPGSQILTDALDNGFYMLMRSAVVIGDKIFIRFTQNVIALDTRSSLWSPVSENLINHWCNSATVAVVKNMLVTCYCEESGQNDEHSIRAYDPQDDVWLTLQGLDMSFHEDAHKSEFMSINGMLVIYHMWEPRDDFKFFVIQIDERLETSVKVNLLWTCSFPRMDENSSLAIPAVSCSTGENTDETSLLEEQRADVSES